MAIVLNKRFTNKISLVGIKKNDYLCITIRPDGGIGRRAGLKHRWGDPSRFDPGSGY